MALTPEKTRSILSKLAIAFACGCFGGLGISIFVPLLAQIGLPELLGVAIHPQLTKEFLYSKVVWGGLW